MIKTYFRRTGELYAWRNDNRNNNGIDIGKTAVAIEYVPGEAAPKILATGKGVNC